MWPAKPIPRFLGGFILAIGLLLAPWPGLKDGHAHALRAVGNALFGHFGAKGIVVFRALDDGADPLHNTIIYLGNRDRLLPGGQLDVVSVKFSSRYTAWLPAALVAALVLATPLPWRRRWVALGWGLLWVHLFIVFVLLVMILHQYAESPAVGLHQWTGLPRHALDALHQILVGYIGASYAVPVLIWIAVAFRRDDWPRLLGPTPLPERGLQAASPSERR